MNGLLLWVGLDDGAVGLVDADALMEDDKKELAADDTFARAVLTNAVGGDVGMPVVADTLLAEATTVSDIPPKA